MLSLWAEIGASSSRCHEALLFCETLSDELHGAQVSLLICVDLTEQRLDVRGSETEDDLQELHDTPLGVEAAFDNGLNSQLCVDKDLCLAIAPVVS